MDAKLTLVLEEEIIAKAKKYARSNGRSLSDLVENYLKAIVEPDNIAKPYKKNSIVNKIKGSITVPEDFDYKKELADNLSKKYL